MEGAETWMLTVLATAATPLLLVPLALLNCYYARVKKRDAIYYEQPKRVEALPMVEMLDAGAEACLRHEMLKWYPRLEVQPESITNKNYKTARTRLQAKNHPKKEPVHTFPPLDPNRKVTFTETCLVFVVYETDWCRGEIEKEENTLDTSASTPENMEMEQKECK